MKKILSILLLSAMLVLVLAGCETEKANPGVTNTSVRAELDAEKAKRHEREEADRIDRLERRVISLTGEVIRLRKCVDRELKHTRTGILRKLFSTYTIIADALDGIHRIEVKKNMMNG